MILMFGIVLLISVCVFTGLWAYDPTVCRPFVSTYVKDGKYNGIPVWIYGMDFGEDLNVKECYCREDGTCPPKGTFDLFRCTGVPMVGSLPHFYKAEQLLAGIESGLNPNHADHGIEVYFEHVS